MGPTLSQAPLAVLFPPAAWGCAAIAAATATATVTATATGVSVPAAARGRHLLKGPQPDSREQG